MKSRSFNLAVKFGVLQSPKSFGLMHRLLIVPHTGVDNSWTLFLIDLVFDNCFSDISVELIWSFSTP